MQEFFFRDKIKEENLSSCYFFYGEEIFLAHQFVQQLKEALIGPEDQAFNLEKFVLGESGWKDIIDVARTIPFFFSSWHLLVVEIPEEARGKLSSLEEKILRDYFSSPPTRTVMVLIVSGKLERFHPLLRFFSSLPPGSVNVKELKTLKDKDLYAWMERKLESAGKRALPEALARLEEIIGSDLRRLSNELEKLVIFVGERKIINAEDVNQVCDWARSFVEWELSNRLEKGDFEPCLVALNSLLKDGVAPEYIVGVMATFFRDIFLAKVWLRDISKDRKEIFKELKPQIQERFRNFYQAKFREFFALVEDIPVSDIHHALRELEKTDLRMKTSDVAPQVLLETFLFDYCSRRNRGKKEKAISRGRL